MLHRVSFRECFQGGLYCQLGSVTLCLLPCVRELGTSWQGRYASGHMANFNIRNDTFKNNGAKEGEARKSHSSRYVRVRGNRKVD